MRDTGYVLDVPYPHHFQRESTPLWLSFVASALGIAAPDISAPYSWCELGCGQGLGAALNAAANPLGRFVAVDFNPRHIAHGRALARAAGLDNLEFVEADFASLAGIAGEQRAQYDFIVLSGVYSWISAADREAVRHCVRHWLKPGGILYLGYMCQPGMAFLSAMQRFLRCRGDSVAGDSVARLQAGLGLLGRMEQGGAGFFREHPAAGRYLAAGRREDPRQLAHELLNAHWDSLHVADVMAALSACGCEYIGSATPLENIDALSLPGNLLPLLQELRTPAERETFKDLARNQSERRDLYQNGVRRLDEQAHRQALLDQVVTALPGAPEGGGIDFDTRIGPVQGQAGLFSPLLGALAAGPCSFAELARLPALQGQTGLISPALQMLAWAGHIHPLLPGEVATERCRSLNQVLCERALQGTAYGYLAAPSLGSAVAADRLQMVALRVLLEYPGIAGRLLRETIWTLLANAGGPGEADLEQRLLTFETVVLPRWRQMGML
ncbi:class I SAM-dependent methyltransferase [Azorhizophilus paspali]|uniref:Methyltransferase regulatory domain-containing protein n=1 Tax=Azorhizophilus paspali TaxID=69963 RepID=A0ABV6SF83_AZOPA